MESLLNKLGEVSSLVRRHGDAVFCGHEIGQQRLTTTVDATMKYLFNLADGQVRCPQFEVDLAGAWTNLSGLSALAHRRFSDACYAVALFLYTPPSGEDGSQLPAALLSLLEEKFDAEAMQPNHAPIRN